MIGAEAACMGFDAHLAEYGTCSTRCSCYPVFSWCAAIFASDTISASAILSLFSPFLSDTLFGCAGGLSTINPGGDLCCLTRCLARCLGGLTCGRTHAGPEVVPERVSDPCEDARRAHIATLRVTLHTPLLAPVLQVMADERTGGADLSGDVPGRGGCLGCPDLL